jgi:hypothetical protein
MASVDLSQTHLKTSHVAAIIIAIVTAAVPCIGVYINLTWEVKKLQEKQEALPSHDQMERYKTEMSTIANHAAAERAKFYLEHAKTECEPPIKRGGKMKCTMVWPPPPED